MRKILTNDEILKEINRVYEGALIHKGKDYGYTDKNMIMKKMRTLKYSDISKQTAMLRMITSVKANMLLVMKDMTNKNLDTINLGGITISTNYMVIKRYDYRIQMDKFWSAIELMEVLSDLDHGFFVNSIKNNTNNMALIFTHTSFIISLMIGAGIQDTSYEYIQSNIDIMEDALDTGLLRTDPSDYIYDIDSVLTTSSERYVEESSSKKSFIVSKIDEERSLTVFTSLCKILDVVEFGEEFDIVSKYSKMGKTLASGLKGTLKIHDKNFRDEDMFYNAFKESGNFEEYDNAYDNHKFTALFTIHINGYIVDFITVFTNDGTAYTYVVNMYTKIAVSNKEVKVESAFENGISSGDKSMASHVAKTSASYVTETLSVIAKHLMNKDSMMNLGDVEYVVKSTSRSIVHTKNVIRHYDNQTVVIAGHMRHYKSGKVALVKPHLRTYSGDDVDVTLKTKIYIK